MSWNVAVTTTKKSQAMMALCMIAYKSHPALPRVCWPARQLRHVTTDGSRRNPNADFQQKFIGDALLTPGWIAACHLGYELPQLGGNARSTSRPRLELPKQTEAYAVPTNQRVGFDDGESVPPVEQTGQLSQRKANGVGGFPSSCFALDI